MNQSRSIPFDSFTFSAVLDELREFVGGKVQDIRQPNEFDIVLSIYARGREAMLLLSCDPRFFRAHFVTRQPRNQPSPPQFLSALRSRLNGGVLEEVTQVPFERVMELRFQTPSGGYRLVAELMGKHSNLILVDPGGKVFAAAKWLGKNAAARPIQPGVPFRAAPVLDDNAREHKSSFYKELSAAGGEMSRSFPVLSLGHGAYPVSVAPLGLPELPRNSISIALEQHYNLAILNVEADSLRRGLKTQVDRVLLARETALADLAEAQAAEGKAATWQLWGELMLAYGPTLNEGATHLSTFDYEGNALEIPLNPDLDYKENAKRLFDKAKKAKLRSGQVADQIARLSRDREDLLSFMHEVETAERRDALLELQERARSRKWLQEQRAPTAKKEERPYEGHRIRELLAPGNFTLLYGENSESNDYLTLRVAKPNDIWLHVRGGVSAHVVIQTRNQPERVQKETLLYAAKVAVSNSPSKHAGYVPVDYTLRKYVRKPKGAPKGTALYTHEKTLHVDS